MHRLPAVWCELVCDVCAVQAPGQWARDRVPMRSLMKIAKHEGFTFPDGGKTLCPKCTKETNDLQNPEPQGRARSR